MVAKGVQTAALALALTIALSVVGQAQSSQQKRDTYTWNGEFVSFDTTAKTMTLKPHVDSRGYNDHSGTKRTCPQCRGLMEYRHKFPILSAVDPNSREPRVRLRDVSGWFCSDPACEYQELGRPTG